MESYHLTSEHLEAFRRHLLEEERAPGTVAKYLRDLEAFCRWLGDRPVTRETAAAWKTYLLDGGRAPVTVNSMVAALNGLFAFLGWDCRVRFLRIQRRVFRDQDRGRDRLALLMETVCSTGIRVGEVPYITVEAARQGRAEIALKGKIRVILLPGKLCRKLLKHAAQKKIASGEIFITRSGRSLSRKQIWAEMKTLCGLAGVGAEKVFPHNLRHLFARTFHRTCRDVVRLADVLGHSSIETTRIYLLTTGTEYCRQLEKLALIL